MNEQIKELAEQARNHARRYVAECKHYGYFMEHNEYDLQFQAKFAELIVRECAKIDFRFKVGMTTDQESDTGRVILDHFGVK